MAGGIPDDVQALIAEHIHSVEQLEVLLLLHRRPERAWSANEVSGELVTQRDSVAERLRDLARRGLIAADGERYRYAAGERDAAVAGLADCYARRRVSVISLIFAKPSETIRSFADAFRVRREG